jgi:hypothetical protein
VREIRLHVKRHPHRGKYGAATALSSARMLACVQAISGVAAFVCWIASDRAFSDTDTLALRTGGEVSALPCTLIVRRHAASGDAWVVRHYRCCGMVLSI